MLVLAILAAVMYVRRVETVEVVATILFIPIFIALVFWDLKGGLIAAVLAILAYVALRYPAIDAVGADRFFGLILSRAVAFLAFGAIGGTANQIFQASLTKLELYDQIDDDTGLYNAGFFVQDTDLELSRSQRYQTVFSIAVVEFPGAPLEGLSRKKRNTVHKDLGRTLGDSIRTMDRAVHANDGDKHLLAVVLPETGPEGAQVFTSRLASKIADYLRSKGVNLGDADVTHRSVTYPNNGEDAIQRLREEFHQIDAQQHPER